MDRCELVFSMRLHGLIFAVQKGIPIITLGSYPKQINLMEELDLSSYLVKANKLNDIIWSIDKLLKNKNSVLDRVLSYREEAVHKIKQDLLSII